MTKPWYKRLARFLGRGNERSAQGKTFALQSYEPDFYVGSSNRQPQVILGLLCPYIVTYFFDSDGNLVTATRHLWKHPAPRMGDDGPYQIYDGDFVQAIEEQIQEWQEQIGFQDKPIRIREFSDEEMYVGIAELPEYLQDADPEDQELAESLMEWKKSGSFVFYWGKDYYMSESGEVEST